MDYVFYKIVSVRFFKSILDSLHLSTRFPFEFLRRKKRAPLDIIKCIFDFIKRLGKLVYRARVDEDEAFAQCCEFRMILIHNQVHI